MTPTRDIAAPGRAVWALMLVAVAWQAVAAQTPREDRDPPPVRLQATVSADNVQVADPFRLTVVAETPDGVSLQWPPTAESLGPFNVLEVQEVREIPTAGGRRSIRVYRLDSYESGQLQIPPIELNYIDRRPRSADGGSADGALQGSAQTEPLTVTITSVLEDQTDPSQFRGIHGVVDLPAEASRPWGLLAATAATVALAVAGLMLVRWRGSRPIHPAQTALDGLDRLQQQSRERSASGQWLVTEVTAVLRRYIEQGFQIAAPRLTTREFLEHAREAKVFDAVQQQRLTEFLESADRVKFGGVEPDWSQASQAIEQARQFVLQTRQAPPRSAIRVAKERR